MIGKTAEDIKGIGEKGADQIGGGRENRGKILEGGDGAGERV